MPLRQLQTGGLVQPYTQTPATDPGQRISGALSGFGAALLQLARFQQEQKVREAQNERRWKMEIASMRAKEGLQQVQMDHDILKLKIDQMNLLAKQAEGRETARQEALTQAVDHAAVLPGVKLETIESELKAITGTVNSAANRSAGDLMSALIANSPDMKAALGQLRPDEDDDELVKSQAQAIARDRLNVLRLAQAERQGFRRALPVGQQAVGLLQQAGSMADPLGSVVPAPQPLGDLQITELPQTAEAIRTFHLQEVAPRLTAMARRDRAAAQLWWAQYVQYYNNRRSANSKPLSLADFERMTPQ